MYIIHLSLLLFTQRQPILIFDLDDLLFYLQDTLHILFCFNVLIQYDWWRIFQCAILIIFRMLINRIDWTWCMCRKITKSYFFSQMGYHSIILSLSGLPRVISSIQFSRSVLSNSLWPHESHAARQVSLSITNSRSLLKLMFIMSVMSSGHFILCCPFLLLSPIPPSIRVFSNESTLHMRWPKYWSFSFSISPFNEHPGLVSFRMDWLHLLAVQGTLKSLFQHHSSKALILWCSAFFRVQLSHPYMIAGKAIALTRQTFLAK